MTSGAAPAAAARDRGTRHGAVSPGRSLVLRRIVAALAAVGLVAAGWWYLAPPTLGGSSTFVIVDGTSMLPKFKRNDLVLIRPASSYHVGEVVAYRSHLLHRVVMHRIVKIHDGLYTFKGDNNNFLDPEPAHRSDLIGTARVHLPALGNVANVVHTPIVAAMIAVVLVLVAGLGGAGATKSEQD